MPNGRGRPTSVAEVVRLRGLEPPETQVPTSVDEVVRGFVPRPVTIPEFEPTVISEFIGGVGTGVMRPTTILRPPEEERVSPHPIARTVGELGGILVSFIPFLKGPQLALRGLGASRPVANLIGGALGFGLFEAGAGPPEGAFERFTEGAAIGLLFESFLFRKAAQSKRAFPGKEDLEKFFDDVTEASVEGIDPTLLAVETAMNAETFMKDPVAFLSYLREIKEPARALHQSLGRMAGIVSQDGLFIVPGIENPELFISQIRAEVPSRALKFAQWLNPRTERYHMLTWDPTQPRSKLVRVFRNSIAEPRVEFAGEGRPIVELFDNTYDDILRFLEADIPEEASVLVETGFTMADLGKITHRASTPGVSLFPSAFEIARRASQEISLPQLQLGALAVGSNVGAIRKVKILIHELSHNVFGRRGIVNILEGIGLRGAEGITPLNRMELGRIAGGIIDNHPDVWRKLQGMNLELRDYVKHILDDPEALSALRITNAAESLATWERELQAATEELLTMGLRSRDAARSLIEGELNYYHNAEELIARFTELVFLNPQVAKELAPGFYNVFARMVAEDSPKLRVLLSRGEPVRLLDWLEAGIQKAPPEFGFVERIFTGDEAVFGLTDDMVKFFERHGFIPGQEVSVEGVRFIAEGVAMVEGEVNVILREPVTGELSVVGRQSIATNPITDVLVENKTLRKNIVNALRNPPEWLGVLIEDTRFTSADGLPGVRKGVLDVRRFELIEVDPDETVRQALDRWTLVSRQAPDVQRAIDAGVPGFKVTEGEITPVAVALSKGLQGVLLREGGNVRPGVFTAIVADGAALQLSDDILYRGLVGEPAGKIGSNILLIDVESATASLLREAGASEAQLAYFMNRARRIVNDDLLNLLSPEVRQVLEAGRAEVQGLKSALDGLPDQAARRNFKTVQNTDGTWSVIDRATNKPVITAKTEDFARASIEDLPQGSSALLSRGDDLVQSGGLDGMSFSAIENAGGGAEPGFQSTILAMEVPEITETVTFTQRIVDAVTNLAPFLTSMEVFAKQVERQLRVPAYSRLFLPAQKAFQRVLFEFERTPKEFLNGRTLTQQLKLIQEIQRKVGRKRSSVVRGLIEYLPREEIEAGILTGEAMTGNAIAVGRRLQELGVHQDVARLTAQLQLMENAIRSKEEFLTRILPQQLARRDLDPLVRETLLRIEAMSEEVPSTIEGMARAIGLSDRELKAVNTIRRILLDEHPGVKPSDLFTISRWGDARPLAEGFNTGRAQFIAENAMNELEIQLATEVQRMMYSGFGDAVQGSRMIAGYWGHMRKWIDAGFRPDRKSDLLRQIVPDEFFDWASIRLQSGELDVYETDMVLLAYKIARSLLMREHFDPHVSGMREVLRTLKGTDIRSHRIMSEYLDELLGIPHTSFRRLNTAVERSMKILGFRGNHRRTAERLVNNMTALAYGASIPFRISLILRNYYQMVQMIPARIGGQWFERGLRQAMTKEGFEQAVQAGAVPLGITPVFASTEALGVEVLRGANLRIRRLFEKGFDWYRKADDIGRAAAYHGQRGRIMHYYDQFAKGNITWETFRARSKVNMFDSNDIAIFEDLVRQGKIGEAADHMGNQLAREAHFRYGGANHPAGWGSVPGRLFGQFGTWPVQYKDFLVQAMTRGSIRDRAEFAAYHIGLNMGLVGGGAAVGVNLWTWASLPSLNYSGGPMADLAIDFLRVWNGSPAERAMAKRSILMQFPSLEDPRSIFVPGSYFLGDINSVFRAGDADVKALFEAGGFRFFEPGEKSGFEWLWGY